MPFVAYLAIGGLLAFMLASKKTTSGNMKTVVLGNGTPPIKSVVVASPKTTTGYKTTTVSSAKKKTIAKAAPLKATGYKTARVSTAPKRKTAPVRVSNIDESIAAKQALDRMAAKQDSKVTDAMINKMHGVQEAVLRDLRRG